MFRRRRAIVENSRRWFFASEITKRQRRNHEDDRHSGSQPGQKIPRAAAEMRSRALTRIPLIVPERALG